MRRDIRVIDDQGKGTAQTHVCYRQCRWWDMCLGCLLACSSSRRACERRPWLTSYEFKQRQTASSQCRPRTVTTYARTRKPSTVRDGPHLVRGFRDHHLNVIGSPMNALWPGHRGICDYWRRHVPGDTEFERSGRLEPWERPWNCASQSRAYLCEVLKESSDAVSRLADDFVGLNSLLATCRIGTRVSQQRQHAERLR